MSDTQAGTPAPSALETLAQIRGKYRTADTSAQTTSQAFERTTVASGAQKTRLGITPKAGFQDETTAAQIYKDIGSLNDELLGIVSDHGESVTDLGDMVKRRVVTPIGYLRIKLHENVFKDKKGARAIARKAYDKRHDAIELLVGKIADITTKIEQQAKEAEGKTRTLQGLSVDRQMRVYDQLRDYLLSTDATTADYVKAARALDEVQKDIDSIEGVIKTLEDQMMQAKQNKDVTAVEKLTQDRAGAITTLHDLMRGRLVAEGTAGDIMGNILNATDGVTTARYAIAQNKTNYQMMAQLVETFRNYSIKYGHFNEMLLPGMRESAQITTLGLQALNMGEVYNKVVTAMEHLTAANRKLVAHAYQLAGNFMRTAPGDIDTLLRYDTELREIRRQQQELNLEWSEQESNLMTMKKLSQQAQAHATPGMPGLYQKGG